MFRLTVAALVLAALAGCTHTDSVTWNTVDLAGALPRTLARSGDTVLVAGERPAAGTYAPMAWLVRDRATPLTLRPRTAYGPTADLVAATMAGDTVTLVGQRAGGAHGIPRWTIWGGTVSDGVDDLPQTFETFGGPDSLGLVALATVGGRPLLLGNWDDGPAFWQASGARWARVPTALRPARALVTGLDVLGERPVVAGNVSRGTGLVPTVWLGSADLTSWRAVPLGDAPVAHTLDLSCGAEVCLVATRGSSGVRVWRIRDGRAEPLPDPPGAGRATWAQVAVAPDGDLAVALPSGLARWRSGEWRSSDAPKGQVRDLLATDDHLYAITGDGDAENSPRRLVTA